jgi:hypothetical protein
MKEVELPESTSMRISSFSMKAYSWITPGTSLVEHVSA